MDKIDGVNGSEVAKKIESDNKDLEEYFEKIKGIDNYAELPGFKDNPFLCLLGSVMKIGWKTKGAENNIASVNYIDSDTGEVVRASVNKVFRRKEYVDPSTFSKIFSAQLKEMFSLSHTALKVYGYIIHEMESTNGKDTVSFRINDCLTFCEWKSRSIMYIGLTELIVKGFICKTDMPWQFFINPIYVFNGNRLIIFNEYIRDDYFQSRQIEGK